MTTNNKKHEGIGRHQILRAVRLLMPHHAVTGHEARSLAERQAQLLRRLLDLDDAICDPGTIASLPRQEVKPRAGLPISGFSEWSRSRWLIAINADDHPTRQRFTLAHEIKHVLDNPYIETLYPGPNGTPSHQRAEDICDYFAACLLMPRLELKRLYYAGNQRVDDLAGHFSVSKAAMGVRLFQIGLTNDRKRCGRMPLRRYQRDGIRPSIRLPVAQGSEAWT